MSAINLAFDIDDDLHIILAGAEPPREVEWELYTRALTAAIDRGVDDVHVIRTLVLTAGGGPSAAQRKVLSDILNGRSCKVAVLADDPAFRDIAAASWLDHDGRAFPSHALTEALDFLGLPLSRTPFALEVATRLEAQLGPRSVSLLDRARSEWLRRNEISVRDTRPPPRSARRASE